jgi:hypothetical protein
MVRGIESALLLVIAACGRKDLAPHRESRSQDQSRKGTVEQPIWKFGEETTRSDPLPTDLDSMRQWGEYADGVRPVAYSVDLNSDDTLEWFVRANQSLCGRAGCPTVLMTRTANGSYADLLDGLVRQVYVTNTRSGGWPVLWLLVGGRDGGVFRMEFRSNRYELSGTLSQTKDAEEWSPADDSLMALLNAASSP